MGARPVLLCYSRSATLLPRIAGKNPHECHRRTQRYTQTGPRESSLHLSMLSISYAMRTVQPGKAAKVTGTATKGRTCTEILDPRRQTEEKVC